MDTETKRTTVYLDADLHRALRLKATETNRSISDLVNEAVQFSLKEDVNDFEAFAKRAREPNLLFEDAVKDLKRRGKI